LNWFGAAETGKRNAPPGNPRGWMTSGSFLVRGQRGSRPDHCL